MFKFNSCTSSVPLSKVNFSHLFLGLDVVRVLLTHLLQQGKSVLYISLSQCKISIGNGDPAMIMFFSFLASKLSLHT